MTPIRLTEVRGGCYHVHTVVAVDGGEIVRLVGTALYHRHRFRVRFEIPMRCDPPFFDQDGPECITPSDVIAWFQARISEEMSA